MPIYIGKYEYNLKPVKRELSAINKQVKYNIMKELIKENQDIIKAIEDRFDLLANKINAGEPFNSIVENRNTAINIGTLAQILKTQNVILELLTADMSIHDGDVHEGCNCTQFEAAGLDVKRCVECGATYPIPITNTSDAGYIPDNTILKDTIEDKS